MPYVPTIAVDFDGTIAEGNLWPDIGPPSPGVREALVLFKQLGYHIIIWSCRTCSWHFDTFGEDPTQSPLERLHVLKMIEWLHAHNLPYDEIDDGTKGKPTADAYVDDKAVRYVPGPNGWKDVAAFIKTRWEIGPENHGKDKRVGRNYVSTKNRKRSRRERVHR